MMALRPILVSKYNPPYPYSSQTQTKGKPRIQNLKEMPQNQVVQWNINRRVGVIATMASLLMIKEKEENNIIAYGLDLQMVAPEQTVEEAQNGVQNHAKALLQVKDFIDSKSWREAQKELRKSSSLLKQDIYTIIQGKPATQRPQLRKLFSILFNNVTKLDYAARDEDESRVLQCYENIVFALNDILSKI